MYKNRFVNFFFAIGRRLSRNDFASFVRYLLDALKADTNTEIRNLAPLIEATYIEFSKTLVARNSGASEAMTFTYTEVVKECIGFVKDVMRKKVLPEHDKFSAMYKTFLPNGISEYYGASQSGFVVIFNRFVSTCVANEVLVSKAIKDQALALQTKMENTQKDKNQNLKGTSDTIASLDEDEAELAKIMFKIYGYLLFSYHANPERAYGYFDFSIIKSTQAEEDKEEEEMPGGSN